MLDEIGAVAPRGVETFSAVLQDLDAVDVGRRAGDAIRSVLRGARRTGRLVRPPRTGYVDFADLDHALTLAAGPGTADRIVVTMN